MLAFIRYIFGYIKVKITGYSPERFMNLCRCNRIVLWDVEPVGQDYFFKMKKSDFKQIKAFVKKTGVRVVITEKCGLPFFMHKNRKRKVFFLGLLFCVIFLYGMTHFLWSFSFSGNVKVTPDLLQHFLEKENVKIGMPLNKVQVSELERKIREEFPVISWVCVKLDGTCLIVEINENDLPNEEKEINNSYYGGKDLVAVADGRIVSIVTRRGNPLVKQGQEVKKGDILVEGAIPINDDAGFIRYYEYVEADADVLLEYTFPYQDVVSRYYEYRSYTGKEKEKVFVKLGSQYYSPNLFKIPYKNYEIWEKDYTPAFIKNINFPLKIGKKIYKEYEELDNMYDDKQAIAILEKRLDESMKDLEEKGVLIIEKNVKIDKDSENIKMTGSITIQAWNRKLVNTPEKIIENIVE